MISLQLYLSLLCQLSVSSVNLTVFIGACRGWLTMRQPFRLLTARRWHANFCNWLLWNCHDGHVTSWATTTTLSCPFEHSMSFSTPLDMGSFCPRSSSFPQAARRSLQKENKIYHRIHGCSLSRIVITSVTWKRKRSATVNNHNRHVWNDKVQAMNADQIVSFFWAAQELAHCRNSSKAALWRVSAFSQTSLNKFLSIRGTWSHVPWIKLYPLH